MTSPTSISEFRERRKPFEYKSRAGETFLLRPVSLTSLISAGSLPSDLMRVAIALSGSTITEREILSHPREFTRLVELVIVYGSVEPKIIEGEGDENSLSVNEIDDQTKNELFFVLLRHSLRLLDKGQEIDLAPFPEDSGGAPDSTDSKVLEPETVEDGRDTGGSSESN